MVPLSDPSSRVLLRGSTAMQVNTPLNVSDRSLTLLNTACGTTQDRTTLPPCSTASTKPTTMGAGGAENFTAVRQVYNHPLEHVQLQPDTMEYWLVMVGGRGECRKEKHYHSTVSLQHTHAHTHARTHTHTHKEKHMRQVLSQSGKTSLEPVCLFQT